MRQPARWSVGRAMLLAGLCAAVSVTTTAGCDDGGTVVLVTVAGLDAQVADIEVVAVLDNGSREAFPRQPLGQALSASQQLGVLLPSGAGGAVSIEVDGYLGDCLVQSGQALVALSGDPLLTAQVPLGSPATCAPVQLQVVGPGVVTSRDAPNLNCGPSASCMYWLDDSRSYVLTATPNADSEIVDWLIDGVLDPDCANLLQCPLTLSPSGHVVNVVFNQTCDPKLALTAPTMLTFGTGSGLHAVWGIAGQEAWAVGDGGTLARYRGSSWSLPALHDKFGIPIMDTLTGIWSPGGNPATLYIVGHQNMVTTSGSSFMVQDPATNMTATVSGTALPAVSAALYGISGFDLANLWAVGAGGAVFKWDASGSKFGVPAISGAGPMTDLYGVVVGDDAAHTMWTVSDKSELYSVAGGIWSTTPGGSGNVVKLLATAEDSQYIYAVGTQSTVIRIPRNAPPMPIASKVATTGADANRSLNSVWVGSGYVFAVGDGNSVFCSRSAGAYWTRLSPPSAATTIFQGVYGNGNTVWIVGANGLAGVLLDGTLP